MNVSCGVIVTDGDRVLLCHPTGSSWKNGWNLPKGLPDPGETPEVTAVREMMEETGLVASEHGDLVYLGRFSYKPDKDLELFTLTVAVLPDVKTLRCDSTFTRGDKQIPEMNGFRYYEWSDAPRVLSPRLAKLWPQLMDKYRRG